MRITLAQARTFLAPFVGTGMAPTNPKVVDAINEAQMRLMPKLPAEGTMGRFRFRVHFGTLTMPREIQSLRRINLDQRPVNIFSRWYEFLNFGPGTMEDNKTSYKDFVDLGDGFCTYSDPHDPLQVLVTSDTAENNAFIRLMGLDENGLEVRSSDGPGELVEILKLMPHYSVNKFSSLTSVVKPKTNGYVSLSRWDPDTSARYDLATYHPDETNPYYRRYQLTGCECENYHHRHDDDDESEEHEHHRHHHHHYRTATILAKLRFIPVSYDTDPLLIQNLTALKAMLQGMRWYDASDFQRGQAYESMAVGLLTEQMNDIEPESNQLNFETSVEPIRGII